MSLRPARNYRALQRPYTRKEYIKSIPYSKITKFDHGNVHGKFEYEVRMVAEASFQVRSNALEAARMTIMSQIRKAIPSEEAYFFKVVPYPHHILRKHAMAGVHKAERLQKGMRLAFGKPDARAAQIRRGDVIMFIRVNRQHLEIAKYCMKLAKLKIPYMTRIDIVRLNGTEGEDEEGA